MDQVGRLFEDCAKAAWNLARALTRTAEDADDIVQQAFTIAVRRHAEIPPQAWPWLARVVANCARNHIRHKARRQGMLDVHETDVPIYDENPADAASRRELARSVHAALAELCSDEREAVALCHISGLTQSEASEIVGVELNTLKSRVRRGLQHLQQKLGLSEAAATTCLSAIAYPPPKGGWESAIARWQSQSTTSLAGSVASPSQLSLKLAGLTALAALAGFGIWLGTEDHNQARPPKGAIIAALDSETSPGGGEKPKVQGATSAATEATGGSESASRAADALPETPAEAPKTGTDEKGAASPWENAGALETRTSYYNTGPLQMQWTERRTDGKWVKEGDFLHLWPNGNIREKGQFLNDERTGPWFQNYEDNTQAIEGGYSKNKPDGVWKTFDKKGNLESEGRFEQGLQTGVWITYHANGQRALIQNLSKGQLHGLETEYDEQGRKRRETHWEQDRKRGWEIIFDENEMEVSRKFYDKK